MENKVDVLSCLHWADSATSLREAMTSEKTLTKASGILAEGNGSPESSRAENPA